MYSPCQLSLDAVSDAATVWLVIVVGRLPLVPGVHILWRVMVQEYELSISDVRLSKPHNIMEKGDSSQGTRTRLDLLLYENNS